MDLQMAPDLQRRQAPKRLQLQPRAPLAVAGASLSGQIQPPVTFPQPIIPE